MELARPPGTSIGGSLRGRQAPRPHSSKQRCAMAAGAPLRPGADAGAAPDGQEDPERRPRDRPPATPRSSASSHALPRPSAVTSAAWRRALGPQATAPPPECRQSGPEAGLRRYALRRGRGRVARAPRLCTCWCAQRRLLRPRAVYLSLRQRLSLTLRTPLSVGPSSHTLLSICSVGPCQWRCRQEPGRRQVKPCGRQAPTVRGTCAPGRGRPMGPEGKK